MKNTSTLKRFIALNAPTMIRISAKVVKAGRINTVIGSV